MLLVLDWCLSAEILTTEHSIPVSVLKEANSIMLLMDKLYLTFLIKQEVFVKH